MENPSNATCRSMAQIDPEVPSTHYPADTAFNLHDRDMWWEIGYCASAFLFIVTPIKRLRFPIRGVVGIWESSSRCVQGFARDYLLHKISDNSITATHESELTEVKS